MWNWLFAFFILFIPFQIAINPAEGVDLASVRIFILGIFVLWLAQSFINRRILLPRSWVALFFACFLFFAGVSVFFADNIEWALRKYAFLLNFSALFFVVAALLEDKKVSLMFLSKSLVTSAVLVSVVACLGWLSQFLFGLESVLYAWRQFVAPIFLGASFSEAVIQYSSWLVNISGETLFRAVATFPDPHMLAFFLGLILPLPLGLFFYERKKIYILLFFIILFAFLMTFSRGAYIGLITALSVSLLWILLGKKKEFGILALTLVVVFIGIFASVENPITNRLLSSVNSSDTSNSGRLQMWEEAYQIIQEQPFTGTGIGNFPVEIKPSAEYREPIYAHNLYLDIGSEMGIFALSAWALLFWAALIVLWKNRSNASILAFYALGLIIFSVHALFDTPLFSVRVLPILLIILAIASASRSYAKSE